MSTIDTLVAAIEAQQQARAALAAAQAAMDNANAAVEAAVLARIAEDAACAARWSTLDDAAWRRVEIAAKRHAKARRTGG
jgi:hypothetical protein